MYIYAINEPDTEKLETVKSEMRALGAPTIRAVWCGDCWRAVEGSHRLAAAHALGLTPNIIEINEADSIEHDCDDLPHPCSAAELLEYAGNTVAYEFEGIK